MNQNYSFSSFEIIKELSPSVYLVLHRVSKDLFSMRVLTQQQKEPYLSIVKGL